MSAYMHLSSLLIGLIEISTIAKASARHHWFEKLQLNLPVESTHPTFEKKANLV